MIQTNTGFIQRAGFLVLLVPASASENDFAAIPKMMSDKLGLPGTPALSGILIDCSQWGDPTKDGWAKLVGQLSGIPGRHKFFAVGLPSGMEKLIKGNSAGLSVELFATVEDVFEKLGAKRDGDHKAEPAKKSKEDAALEKVLLETFQQSAIHTLQIQCSTKFKAGKPFLKNQQNKIIHDIAASMGLMSKAVSGTVALGFKEDTFLKVMGKMLGETYSEITTDVEDGCGELLNIIFGQAKKALTDAGHQFGKTLPTIFIGHALRVRQLTPNPAFILPFESDLGQMVLEVGYRRT